MRKTSIGIRWETRDNILMSVVGVVFFLNMLLLSGVLRDVAPGVEELNVVGWIVLGGGALFVIFSVLTLRKNGTASFTDRGIYSIVRHPMYLGGMLMFSSHIIFGQDWIIAATTLVGVFCCYFLTLSEDERIIEKFGAEYRQYMHSVPRLNFVAGVIRVLRRKCKH